MTCNLGSAMYGERQVWLLKCIYSLSTRFVPSEALPKPPSCWVMAMPVVSLCCCFSRKNVPDWNSRPDVMSDVQVSLNKLRLWFTEWCFKQNKIVQNFAVLFISSDARVDWILTRWRFYSFTVVAFSVLTYF